MIDRKEALTKARHSGVNSINSLLDLTLPCNQDVCVMYAVCAEYVEWCSNYSLKNTLRFL